MKVRIRFSKLGKIRWTSHRDMARVWERAFRRAEIPVAYSQGFSPRPKLSFGLALPTGSESVAEYLDVDLAPPPDGGAVDVVALPARLNPALSTGITVQAAAAIDERAVSLQADVTACTWEVEAVGLAVDALVERVEKVLAAESLVVNRNRKGTEVAEDVRPAILDLTVVGPSPCIAEGYADHGTGVVIAADLAAQPRAARPSDLLLALGEGLEIGHVRRVAQWIERDGARTEPLVLGAAATGAPHAHERAS